MTTSRTIKARYAWILTLIFMTALVVKTTHFHSSSHNDSSKVFSSHQAEVKASCYICDFTFHKGELPKQVVFVPVICVELLSHHVFSPQTVYRTIISINTHSPPYRV